MFFFSDFCTLQGQVEHKLRYIDEFIPRQAKLVLIGHSIGCYIILHMLEQLPRDRILICPLLFPTVERMAESPKGFYFTPLLKFFRYFLIK